jgi:hypothetical protein
MKATSDVPVPGAARRPAVRGSLCMVTVSSRSRGTPSFAVATYMPRGLTKSASARRPGGGLLSGYHLHPSRGQTGVEPPGRRSRRRHPHLGVAVDHLIERKLRGVVTALTFVRRRPTSRGLPSQLARARRTCNLDRMDGLGAEAPDVMAASLVVRASADSSVPPQAHLIGAFPLRRACRG